MGETKTETAESKGRAIPVVMPEELDENPHQIFEQYRRVVPFIRMPNGVYMVLRYRDVLTLNDETKTRQLETDYLTLRGISSGPLWEFFKYSMLTSNGDVHKRRRGPMARTFAYRMVAELRPMIRKTAEAILDQHGPTGELELLADYASPIPARTIAHILGLGQQDIPRFTSLVYTFTKAFSSFSASEVPIIEAAVTGLLEYIEDSADRSRRGRGSQLIRDYLASVDSDGGLSHIEAMMQLFSLVVGGSDTTRAAIVIQTSLLLQHREQWQELIDHPDMISNAVLECLRYEPTTATVHRVALEDITIDGYVVPKGSVLALMTISAMRDDSQYTEPNNFDIRRPQVKWHPIFGSGAHRCLGEALAKAELEESLAALLNRYPRAEVIGDFPNVTGYRGIRRVGEVRLALAAS